MKKLNSFFKISLVTLSLAVFWFFVFDIYNFFSYMFLTLGAVSFCLGFLDERSLKN